MTQDNIVGQRIKALRERRNMSIEELAGGLPGSVEDNAEQIAKLENGESVPSLTPLLQIARALGVRLGSFLDDQTTYEPVITRKGNINETASFVGSNLGKKSAELGFHSLAANKSDRHMEPFIIDVQPHNNEKPVLSTHEGEEFIYVLEGDIEIAYGKNLYTVSAGDSIYYDSIVPHHLHAAGDKEAKILAVVYAPF